MAALLANVAQPSPRSLPNVDLLSVVLGFGVLLVSLTIHEAAHALTADRLGDPTARSLGPRVAQSDRPHRSDRHDRPAVAGIVSHLPLIGWAKPVPVDTRNLRHPQRDFAIIAAAGPVSNLLQAIAASILYRFVISPAEVSTGVGHGVWLLQLRRSGEPAARVLQPDPGAAAGWRQRAAGAAAARAGRSVLADSGSSAS